jgi:hypothetical protein
MATRADVRRIALALPGVEESTERFAFSVENKGKSKGIAWVWLERTDPKKARVPQPKVLAIRVASLSEKDMILSSDSRKFFTEPHYNGYPAVLVRLAEVTVADLRMLIGDAWRSQAPRELVRAMSDGDVAPSAEKPAKKVAKKRTPAKSPVAKGKPVAKRTAKKR